jgi:hypothetical protein
MAESAAHLADHVIPPMPVRQWVISVPKRLRGVLADRPVAVTALTRIFLDEIERWLGAAVAIVPDAAARQSLRPRLGAVSFLHRFGSALNRHVHLHACVTDGLFMPVQEGVAFLPARPVTPADLLTLTERVRTRLVRWFFRHGLLDAEAAATQASPPLPRGVCAESPAPPRRHGAGHRQCDRSGRRRIVSPSPSGRGPG